MEVSIDFTRRFEKDLDQLSKDEKVKVTRKIDDFAREFATQKAGIYRKLRKMPLSSRLKDYESSLYILTVSHKLRIILSLDEDPIFEQVIFTFFRAVQSNNLGKVYQGIEESLYQEILHHGAS